MGGPGETQIEIDRRLIGERVIRLKKELESVTRTRQLHRQARKRIPYPIVALVGYTNAGKSTLFNRLTRERVHAADQLFATLDTTLRRVWLPGAGSVVLSDTVGFIRDLPHDLVAAFRATLAEAADADLLIHVVDASAPDRDRQVAAVDRVLVEIGAADVPRLVVMNKIDRAGLEPGVERDACGSIVGVRASAATGAGIDALKTALAERLGGDPATAEAPTATAVP